MGLRLLDPENYSNSGEYIGEEPSQEDLDAIEKHQGELPDMSDEEVLEIMRRHEEDADTPLELGEDYDYLDSYYDADEDEQAMTAMDFSGDPFYGRELDFNV